MTRQTLLTDWHFMRWVRLVMGVFIAMQAIQLTDPLLGFLSVIFLFQAVTNTGCCGTSGCAVPATKTDTGKMDETEFEEIKTK